MLKTLKTACVITTITSLATLAARAEDQQGTSGTPGYQSKIESTLGEFAAKGFIKEAYRDNQMELQLAGIGQNKAQNAELKTYCEQIQKHHTQANKDLQPLAQKYGVTEDQSWLREHEVNKFEKESSGPEFDKNLATEMLKSHQKALGRFERAALKLKETDVKQYAENMLPKLREHLQHGATVAQAVGVDPSTISSIMSKTPAVGGTGENQEFGTGSKTEKGTGAKQPEPTPPSAQPQQ